MSAPDPRYPDKNSVPSIFARKRKPEEQTADDAIERLRDIPDHDRIDWLPQSPPPPPRNRLAEIAVLVEALRYGEMVELAFGIWQTVCALNENRKEGEEPILITKETLPMILHQWSSR